MDASVHRELRDVLGTFVTGVTVVTTRDAQGQPHGVTVNSFSSVSLDPPLVLWSQSLTANSYPAFRDSDYFVVNILAEHQIEVSQRFARAGADKFGGVDVSNNEHGMPRIEGSTAFIECRKVAAYPGGDHVVFLGQVERSRRTPTRPLAFGNGKYMVAHVHDLGPVSNDPAAATLDELRALRLIHHALPDIASRLEGIVGLGVWANRGPTILRWEPGPDPVTRDLVSGVVVSPTDSATGLAFCAYLPQRRHARVVEAALASHPITDLTAATFEERLAAVRKRGVARSVKQTSVDIAGVSAPIFNRDGRMIAALTLADRADTLPGGDDCPRETALRQEAATLSHRIGAPAQRA